MTQGIIWDTGELIKGIDEFGGKLIAGVSALMEYNADAGEAMMRSNAPWTDRTGNARQGLAARAYGVLTSRGRDASGRFTSGNSAFGIVFFHQVPYGIWLETKWSGRYAIIMPTIFQMGPDVMDQCNDLIRSLR